MLLLLTAAVYFPVASADFVWDDQWLLVENVRLRGDLLPLLATDYATLSDLPGQAGYWRPLLMADYWMDWRLFGLDPMGWHLHSLGWHLIAVGFLFRLLQPFGPWPALGGAAWMALHPLNSEAVAWVSARNDPMATALLLGGLLALRRRERAWWGVGALLSLGALLCKESAILAPVFLWGLETVPRPPLRPRLLVIGAALGLGLSLRPLLGIPSPPLLDLVHLQAALPRFPFLLGLVGNKLLGFSLSSTTHLQYLQFSPVDLIGWLVLVLLVGKRPGGLALAFIALVPSLWTVIQTGIFGDRYLYLPMVGLSLGLARTLAQWNQGRAEQAGRFAGMVVLLLLAGIYRLENRLLNWMDGTSLFSAEVENAPNPYNRQLLAWYLLKDKRPEAALKELLPLLNEHPPIPELYDTGLRAAVAVQQYREAQQFGEAGIVVDPNRNAEYRGLLALSEAAMGQWDRAEYWGKSTLEEAPEGPGALAVAAAQSAAGAPPPNAAVQRLLELGMASRGLRPYPEVIDR